MKKILFGILMAMSAVGCTEYESGEVEQLLKDGKIVFSVSEVPTSSTTRSAVVAGEALQLSGAKQNYWLLSETEPMVANVTTRGTQLTASDFMTSFGVSCYKTPNSMDDLGGRVPDYFYNLEATRVGETTNYTISQDYYWPSNDERLWFFAYYPYNSGENLPEDNLNVVLSSAATLGPQTIDYTVAAAATNQVDLMTATTGKTDDFLTEEVPTVELQFEHQLTGIRFKVGDQFPTKGYIQSIQLKNVYTHGVYTIGGTWSHQSGDIGNFIVEYANDTKVTDTPGQMITDDNAVFLMIPATFTYEANTAEEDKAAIIVRFWDGDQTQTVEASLEGTTWTAGQTVTYSLSSEKLTTLKIDHIDYATTPAGAPYTEWKNGDEVGLYVVANGKNGGTDLRYTNVKCTYSKPNEQSAGTWVIDQVAINNKWKPVIMYPGDNYYFYYPYHAEGPNGTPSAGNESDASADKFWNSVVSAHSVLADQSTPANFKNSDLQIAKAIVPSDVNANDQTLDGSGLAASTIKATMARKVGLARLKFATSKEIPTTVTRTNNGSPTNTGTTTISPSANFNGNVPNHGGTGNVYFFYTNAGEETSFNSVATDANHWAQARTVTLAAGEYTSDDDMNNNIIQDYRYQWEFVTAIYDYSYTSNNAYTLTSPIDGTATLEVWGAQGGGSDGIYQSSLGGLGGYSYGNLQLSDGDKLHICVGGWPGYLGSAGGYNGGGTSKPCSCASVHIGGGGGGCTHIAKGATHRGVLANYNGYRGEVMLVAGGGGGSDDFASTSGSDDGSGGTGGGESGGNAYENGVQLLGTTGYGRGATQETGYAFGVGQDTYPDSSADIHDSGAGGGGWMGGYAGHSNSSGGGGGSGYTNTSALVANSFGMQNGVRAGNGFARITLTH